MRGEREDPPRKRDWRRKRRPAPAPLYAAIDLGTHNCRLLMAKPTGRGFRVVDSFSRIVRLGEGLSGGDRLSEDAIHRTVEALRVCARKIEAKKVRQVRAVATEACRRAVNGADLLERVTAETGLVLETISADEEARLILTGSAPLLDYRYPYALIFDIGGGSTDLMWVELAPGRPPEPLGSLSLPIGVVDLAERHGGGALPARVYARLVDDIDAALAPFEQAHGIAREITRGRAQMLGTSGTVTTLGGVFLDLPRYDRSKVDGLVMKFTDIAAVSARLGAMDLRARGDHPCIGHERADLVVVGCGILEAICRRWPAGRLRIADRGIREGLLLGMIAADAPSPRGAAATPAPRPEPPAPASRPDAP